MRGYPAERVARNEVRAQGERRSANEFCIRLISKVCKTRFPLLVLLPQILRRYRSATFKHLCWRAGKDNLAACFSSVRAYVDYVV